MVIAMPRIYVLKESYDDPVLTKANLVDYEASVDARFDATATTETLNETKQQIDQSLSELESRCGSNLDGAKDEIGALIDKTKKEMSDLIDSTKKELEQSVSQAKQELQKNDQDMKQEIMAILEQIKVKASDTEPQDAEDLTVWFDLSTKLTKVRKSGQWIPFGGVYQ